MPLRSPSNSVSDVLRTSTTGILDAPRRARVVVTALVLLIGLVIAQLLVPALTRSATSRTFVTDADATVDANAPDTNFGSDTTLSTDANPFRQRAYLHFNLGTLHNVQHATLRLYSTSDNDLGVSVREVGPDAWAEATIDSDHRPRIAALVGHSPPTTTGEWTEIDVTAMVEQDRSSNAPNSLTMALTRSPFASLVAGPDGKSRESKTRFASRETGSTAPQLVVMTNDSVPTVTEPPTTTTTSRPSSTTTSPTTTTVAPPPTTTVPPPPGCVAVSGSVQSAVNANPAGAAFCIQGTHNETVTPKDGQRFTGGVFDGGGSRSNAFGGSARNVTLDGVEVRNYNSPNQRGAIKPADHAAGWTLRNVQVHDNAHGGISVADGMKIFGGRVYSNGQEGLSGDANNVVNTVLLDGVEVDHNATNGSFDCGWEAGGFKWTSANVTVRNSHIHHNRCKGLWSDWDALNLVIENNLIEFNGGEGVFIETSHGAIVRNNVIRNNGGSPCSWLFGGGVTVPSSDNVQVYGNTLTDNCNGVTGNQQNRGDHLLKNFAVHDNTISGAGKTGAAQDNGTDLATRNITFTNNQILNGQILCGIRC